MTSQRVFRRVSWLVASTILLAGCSGGSTFSPRGSASPTPLPTGAAAAFVCPSSAASTSAARSSAQSERRRLPERHVAAAGPASTGLIAVSYSRSQAQTSHAALVNRELSVGASLVREYDFPNVGRVTRVLSVAPARAASVEATLRSQPGVLAVGDTGVRRYASAVTTPFFPNDPYFTGFATTEAPAPGASPPPPTFEVGPLEESASVPGQWNMHAIQLEHAFAYSQPGNGSGLSNPKALGSSAVKIAIIDTGEDSTHPDLSGKLVYQKCYITSPSHVRSTSNFSTDELGHGTDVSGLAAATLGNGFGFTGAGGNVVLYGYRVFPTPDDNCLNSMTSDPQCGADDGDIVSAINDAVAQHVNVISMSLGEGSCSSGGADPDPLEGDAVANAIAANIVVVAASGNDSSPGSIVALEAPACDRGVIAAGATGLADGQPNGAGNSNGTASNPFEYVASYSNAGSPGAAPNSPTAWGLVAPGADPSPQEAASSAPGDNLHWIWDIWTTTPYQASPTDQSFTGECSDDYPNSTSVVPPVDCRVEIAGTSMSAPLVAGAAALVLSVNPTYQSASAMKQLLCSTADDIGDPHEGCGRLNVYRAMAAALGDPSPPPVSGSP